MGWVEEERIREKYPCRYNVGHFNPSAKVVRVEASKSIDLKKRKKKKKERKKERKER